MRKIILAALVTLILSSTSAAGDWCYTKEGYVVAATEALYDRGLNMLKAKDKSAFLKLTKSGLVSITREGARVYREDVKMYKCIVRPEGETVRFWTSVNALRCN